MVRIKVRVAGLGLGLKHPKVGNGPISYKIA